MNRNDHNFSNPILINLPVVLFAFVTLTLAPRAGAVCQQGCGDPAGIPQFGLVAEQVETVDPDLIVRDDQGRPYTVRYEAVNAMLLNEFLKEHRAVEEQKSAITQTKSALFQQDVMIRQEKEIQTLSASLKEQIAQIEKVSNQLQLSKAPSQLTAS